MRSAFIRVGELTRMRKGDRGTGDGSTLGLLPFSVAADGICGWGRRTCGVTGNDVRPIGGECVLIGGEFSPSR